MADIQTSPDEKRRETVNLRKHPLRPLPPRDAIEGTLALMLEKTLNLDAVAVHDSYYGIGGTCDNVPAIVDAIRQRFNVDVDLSPFLANPTVAELAHVLRSLAAHKEWDPIIPIQPSGQRPPLFCIHTRVGTAEGYCRLAKHLGGNQPIYGLEAKGVLGNDTPHLSISEMAQHYLAAIKRVQPLPPYFVGGWSSGGLIALEIAKLLRNNGDRVSVVMMFDTFVPDKWFPTRQVIYREWMSIAIATLEHQLRYYYGVGEQVDVPSNSLEDRLKALGLCAIDLQLLQPGIDIGRFRRQVEFWMIQVEAIQNYRPPQSYDGDVALFTVSDKLEQPWFYPHHAAVDYGWSKFLPRHLEVIPAPGRHITMFSEPHVKVLAGLVSGLLRKYA